MAQVDLQGDISQPAQDWTAKLQFHENQQDTADKPSRRTPGHGYCRHRRNSLSVEDYFYAIDSSKQQEHGRSGNPAVLLKKLFIFFSYSPHAMPRAKTGIVLYHQEPYPIFTQNRTYTAQYPTAPKVILP